MEKRLPLALILGLLFIWFYSGLTATPPAERDRAAAPAGSASPDPGATTAPPAVPTPIPGLRDDPEQPLDPSEPVPFEGTGFTAQFETRGAGLSWLDLADYHTKPHGDQDFRLLGQPNDDVPSLLLREFNGRYPLERVAWEVEAGLSSAGFRQLVFRWRAPDGVEFTRTVTERDEAFLFDLHIEVHNAGESDPGGTLMLVLSGAHGLNDEPTGTFLDQGPAALAVVDEGEGGTDTIAWRAGDLDGGAARRIGERERLLAAGSMTNYFTSVLIPDEDTRPSQVEPFGVVDGSRLELAVAEQKPSTNAQADARRVALRNEHMGNGAVNVLIGAPSPAPGQTIGFDFTFFAGPKDKALSDEPAYGSWLAPIVSQSYGNLAWINHGLLAILRFFHFVTGNWGFAIILLTLVVRVLLFPLNRVQQSSMAKYSSTMQQLKPEIDALKERHKNNKKKFNEEQMKLLRKHGATPPLGGCLLIFLQFPIWISLFQILRSSIELRHAPFVAWVDDLSRADQMLSGVPVIGAINLLPILMAVATMAQMRFQPKPADEQQAQMQKIMGLMMPLMMLWFLYDYPSGLALYIFTSSLLGIFEYQVIRKRWPPPHVIPAGTKPVPVVATTAKPKGKKRR